MEQKAQNTHNTDSVLSINAIIEALDSTPNSLKPFVIDETGKTDKTEASVNSSNINTSSLVVNTASTPTSNDPFVDVSSNSSSESDDSDEECECSVVSNRSGRSNSSTSYQSIIAQMKAIISTRELTHEEAKILSNAVTASMKNKHGKQKILTMSVRDSASVDIQRPQNNTPLPVQTPTTQQNTHVDIPKMDETEKQKVQESVKKQDVIVVKQSSTVKQRNEHIKEYMITTIVDAYAKKINRELMASVIDFKTLITLLYFGADELDAVCKDNGIDVERVLLLTRERSIIKNRMSYVLMFEKFINRFLLNTYVSTDHMSQRARFINSLDRYDRSSGILVTIDEHVKQRKKRDQTTSNSWRSRNSCLTSNVNSKCRCIRCKGVQVVDNSFTDNMRLLMTDNPYDNILVMERYIYTIVNSGVLKEHFKRVDYRSKCCFSAAAYIDKVKTKTLTCSTQRCYDYFLESLQRKTSGSIPKDHKTHPHTVIKNDSINEEHLDMYLNGMIRNTKLTKFLKKNSAHIPDSSGVSPQVLWMLGGDVHFKSLLNDMATMLDMSSELPREWCDVDTYPLLKRDNMSTDNPENFRLIVTHNIFVNYFHTRIGKQLQKYLIEKGYFDMNIQKAFTQSNGTLSGTRELYTAQNTYHNKKKDLIITFLDIKNAYGSLSHEFIEFVLKQYNVPDNIANYIMNFYTLLRVRVLVNGEYTEYFKMDRGLLQGDHLSNIIFTMCIGYIINTLREKFKSYKPTDVKNMFSCFVDDILIHTTDPKVTRSIVTEFIRLNSVLKTGLELSFDKSYILIVGQTFKNVLKNGMDLIVDNTRNVIRVLENDEVVRYLGSYVDPSSEYDMDFINYVNYEMISDFRQAEIEMIKKGVFDPKKKRRNVQKNTNLCHTTELHNPIEDDSTDELLELVTPDALESFTDEDLNDFGAHRLLAYRRAIRSSHSGLHKEITGDDNRTAAEINNMIVQKIYGYLISKVEWKLTRLIMTVENMNDLILRLDNISNYYATRWDVVDKTMRIPDSKQITVRNAIQIILHEKDKDFKQVLDDTIVDLYKKTQIPYSEDRYKQTYDVFYST